MDTEDLSNGVASASEGGAGADADADASADVAPVPGPADGGGDAQGEGGGDSGCGCPSGTRCSDAGCELETLAACQSPYLLPVGKLIHVTLCDDAGTTFQFDCPAAGVRPAAFFQVPASAKPWGLDIQSLGAGVVFASTTDCATNISCTHSDTIVSGQVPSARRFAVTTKSPGCQALTIQMNPPP